MVLEHYGIPTAPFAVVHADTIKGKPPSLTWEDVQGIIQSSKHAKSFSSYPLFAKPLADRSDVVWVILSLCKKSEYPGQAALSVKGQDIVFSSR